MLGKGLQVLTNDGEWIDAIAEKDEIIINVGDMLSRYTNNKLKSTIHKVVNPPKDQWKIKIFHSFLPSTYRKYEA